MNSLEVKTKFFEVLSEDSQLFSIIQEEGAQGVVFGASKPEEFVWIDSKIANKLGYQDNSDLLSWQDISTEINKYLAFNLSSKNQFLLLKKHDGTTVPVLCNFHFIENNERQFLLCTFNKPQTQTKELLYKYKQQESIFDNADFHIIKVSPEGFYTYVNDFYCRKLEFIQEELIGKNSLEDIIVEDHDKCKHVAQQCFEQPNTTFKVVLRKKKKITQKYIANEWEFTLLLNTDGSPKEVLCIGNDITVDVAHHEELEQLSIIHQNMNNGVFVTNENLNLNWHNSYLNLISGFNSSEIRNKDFTITFFGNSIKKFFSEYKGSKVFKCKRKDNSFIWLSVDVFPFHDKTTQQRYYIFICTDVTEIHRKNSELLQINQQLKLAISTTELGMWILDLKENQLEWNNRLYEIYGLDKEALSHNQNIWRKQVSRDDIPKLDDTFTKALKGKDVSEIYFKIRHNKTKKLKYLLGSGLSIKNEDGEVEKLMGINIDVTNLKQQQQELENTKAMLEGITNSIPGAVLQYKINSDGTDELLFLSKGIELLWEVSLADALSDTGKIWSLIVEEDIPIMQDSILHSANHLTLWDCDHRIRTPKGKLKWLNGRGYPVRQKDGSTIWNTIVLDITEKKNFERALKKEKDRFELVTNSIPGAVFRYKLNMDGTDEMLFLSQGAEQLWEITTKEALENTERIWSLVIEEDLPMLQASILDSAKNLTKWNANYRIKTASGKIKWLNGIGQPKRQDDGSTVWDTLIFDITENKNIEAELKESQKNLENIANNIPGAVTRYKLYPDGKDEILFLSKGAEEVWGYSISQMLESSKILWEVILPEDEIEFRNSVIKSAEELSQWNHEYRIKTKQGQIKWLNGRGIPTKQDDDSIVWNTLALDITDKKNTEAKLIESQRRFESIANSIPGGVLRYKINTDGTDELLFFNRGAEQVWETTQEDAIKDVGKIWAMIFEQDALEMQASIAKSAETQSLWHHEYRIKTPSGKIKWLNGRGLPTHQDDGSVIWNSLVFEITEKKNIENALKRSEERLKLSIDGADLGLWDWNVHTGQVVINERWAEMLGYTLEEIQPVTIDTWMELSHPNEKEKSSKTIEEYFNKSSSGKYEMEIRMRHKAGHWIWILTKGKLVERDSEGNPLRMSGTHLDITERVFAQKQIEMLAHISENTTDLLLICDSKGRVTWANETHEKILGVSPNDIIGRKPIEILKTPSEGKQKAALLNEALYSQKRYNDIIPLYSMSGNLKWISYNVSPIFNDKDEFLYSIVTKKDVTDLVQKQKELEVLLDTTTKQNDRLKEYSYIVSHNIRSSVARIKGLSQLLKEDPTNPLMLAGMETAAEKLDVTINNINNLLHLEKEFIGEKEVKYDVIDSLRRIIELNQHIIEYKNAQVLINAPEKITINTIPAYFDSILQNLITNALKYGITSLSYKVEVIITDSENELVIAIKDYGMGINLEKYKDKLFKLGSRLHDISKGQGMGLFMTKRQVEALRGTINIESKEFKGSTFTVKLPK